MGLAHTMKGVADSLWLSVALGLESVLHDVPPEITDARLDWWAKRLLRGAEIELVVRGAENAGDGSEALLVVSNHQSLYDIPVLVAVVPGRLRMVAKAVLFRIPLWGRAMNAAGTIRVDRHDLREAARNLQQRGTALLAKGTRVWLAPEGTRSRTGVVGPFKHGGFRLAIESGVRILPIAIDGKRNVLAPDGYSVRCKQRVTVTLLSPIDPKGYTVSEASALAAEVRARIVEALGQSEEARPELPRTSVNGSQGSAHRQDSL